ncbi:MAG: hypothetical protein EOP84_23055 [Verrucomicrobiaceae bacterium]|nr:MAG: hypothetical protein EOP84_23055 [Verrucomicrobiaceae bacterium]
MGEVEGDFELDEYESEIDQPFPSIEAAGQRLLTYDQIYRLYLGFGIIREELLSSFYVEGPDPETYACLDGFNLYVGPISPSTLSYETEEPLGFVVVSFSGSGYFTWTTNNERVVYDRIVALPEVQRVSQVSREFFPVSEDLVRGKFSDSIGKLWLNRNEWKEGDWIWTITENG